MSDAPEIDPFVPLPYRVTGLTRETADTVSLDLAPVEGEAPSFEPGQFNMLYAFGVGEIAISISGDPADRSRLSHTVRAVGAGSAAIARLAKGEILGVRGPFGSSWPLASAEGGDLVLVAGGLGLAPLRPAVYHALAARSRYRRVIVLVGMRNPAEVLYRAELEGWRTEGGLEVEVTVDRAAAGWPWHVGVVTSLIPRLGLDASRTVALICGPEIMMRFAVVELTDARVHPGRIYVSLERNMKCAIGLCGHCQFGPAFVCKDGPVLRLERIARMLACREM